MTKPRTPPGLSQKAARFWRDVVTNYQLRADELRILEDACREASFFWCSPGRVPTHSTRDSGHAICVGRRDRRAVAGAG
jgi:hypothetical protein